MVGYTTTTLWLLSMSRSSNAFSSGCRSTSSGLLVNERSVTKTNRLINDDSSSSSSSRLYMEQLENLKIPFFSDESSSSSSIENTPEVLYNRAKTIIDNDLGIQNPMLLDDEFVWIGPSSEGAVLGKDDYIAAGRFFDLRSTFPDLDYRAHDFRMDELDPQTVRITARVVGTMRGELRLRKETLPPNGKRMVCPPEAISMKFSAQSGLLTKLTSGFTLDRQVGNTQGLTSVQAAAVIAGVPPPSIELYSIPSLINQFFARSVEQLPGDSDSYMAPFPETVMIQLAKGVLSSGGFGVYGDLDGSLFGADFKFLGDGGYTLSKDDFLKEGSKYNLKEGFPDLSLNECNFRVDPYDPYRVWVDTRGKGTRTGAFAGQTEGNGAKYEGPPEALSFTFDDDGFCTRLTAGAVMDPTQGNTGGLGGIEGIKYATGTPSLGIFSRPFTQSISRVQKKILEPLTGIGVDDYKLPKDIAIAIPDLLKVSSSDGGGGENVVKTPEAPKKKPDAPPKQLVNQMKGGVAESSQPQKVKPTPPLPPKTKPSLQSMVKAKTSAKPSTVKDEPVDPVSDAFSSFFGVKPTTDTSSPAAAKATSAKKKQTEASAKLTAAKQARDEAAQKAQNAREEASLKKAQTAAKAQQARQEAAEKRAKDAADAANKRKEAAANAKRAKDEAAAAKKKGVTPAGRNKKAVEVIDAAKARTQEIEEKKAAAAEARRIATEEKKAIAEARKQQAEEKRAAAAAVAEEKRAAATAAAEEKRAAVEARKQEAQQQRADMMAKKQAESLQNAKKRQAVEALGKAKPGGTISLFDFFKNQKDDAAAAPSKTASPSSKSGSATAPKVTSKAPRGVPTVTKWKQVGDGSIKGFITGSPNFSDGEAITTSPINGDATEDCVVQTDSGSRYYLSGPPSQAAAKGFAFFFGSTDEKTTPSSSAAAATTKNTPVNTKDKRKQAAAQALTKAKPGGTISLANMFFATPKTKPTTTTTAKGTPSSKKKPSPPPRGMPIFTKWRINRDGSITGKITGTAAFEEGEMVTTSIIASGDCEEGNVVQTKSGSKYYLS